MSTASNLIWSAVKRAAEEVGVIKEGDRSMVTQRRSPPPPPSPSLGDKRPSTPLLSHLIHFPLSADTLRRTSASSLSISISSRSAAATVLAERRPETPIEHPYVEAEALNHFGEDIFAGIREKLFTWSTLVAV